MANNEVSGIVLLTYITKFINKFKNRYYSYRIIFIPETIGSIAYIHKNKTHLQENIIAGFNVTCVGDEGNFSLLLSKYENSFVDKLVVRNLKIKKVKFKIFPWLERGSDERQYCSPLVNLPIISLMKSKYGEYKEYHTSLDKIGSVVTEKGLNDSLKMYKFMIKAIEKSIVPICRIPCEPFLTKHRLVDTLGAKKKINKFTRNILNFLTYSDGTNSIEDISNLCKLKLKDSKKIYNLLKSKKLIKKI